MTSALEQIREAERLLGAAAEQWNAVDLRAIGNCLSALEYSATSLRAAHRMILQGSPEQAGGPMRTAVIAIRIDAGRLQRLVDASAAFLRGVPGAECADAELYRPGGSTHPIEPVSQSWGMQG